MVSHEKEVFQNYTYSPWTIVLETGQYIEVHKKSDNRTKSRTQPGIYLYPLGNDLEGGYLLRMNNREHVHQNRATVTLMLEDTVDKVHKLARQQMYLKDGLEF